MEKLTKREIKFLKKYVIKHGAVNAGYYYEIEKVLNFSDVDKVMEYAYQNGVNLFDCNYNERLDTIVTLLAELLNYQEFKKLVPYFIGYTGYKLINNELVEVVKY